jgi:hypothetical protein
MIEVESDGPLIGSRFYYSDALPYLIERDQEEIRRRLIDTPRQLRQGELAPRLAPMEETGGAQRFRYCAHISTSFETKIAEFVVRHSPSFWIHLHRRLRPMLSPEHTAKTDDTTVHLVRRIAELGYAKHGDLKMHDDLGPVVGSFHWSATHDQSPQKQESSILAISRG